MVVQDLQADLGQGRLDRLDLSDDVDAVGLLLQHALDAADVAFGSLQAARAFAAVHRALHSSPPRGGGGQPQCKANPRPSHAAIATKRGLQARGLWTGGWWLRSPPSPANRSNACGSTGRITSRLSCAARGLPGRFTIRTRP